ncbi:MAG: flagellar transcriptional regulator FlhC [gamma proteobacterium endosymbiont of Lamellibrachia anaximandri]|nr:flagellar transcriptional regulator FlhC [gamma proteobacterium endosymbiont of Lamellibrachia anaximandri]MBL3533733.1 flagellar transcriptional regulator FlhC [gamma proteobacterium endosymbiont of Lamellibrachia anaximandri]
MKLAAIHNLDTAVALIHRGLRLSIVSHITGIHPKILRSLHHEIHGRRPTSGQMPSSSGILSTRLAQATASVFAGLYRSTGGSDIYDQINMTALLAAHDLYLELIEGIIPRASSIKPIDINQAWGIARDIQTKAVYFKHCSTCRIWFLCSEDSRLSPSCPICALRRRNISGTLKA